MMPAGGAYHEDIDQPDIARYDAAAPGRAVLVGDVACDTADIQAFCRQVAHGGAAF